MDEENKNKNLKWYIVKASSGQETKTAELLKQRIKANNLEEKLVEVIVPMQEKIVIKKGKKQTIEERIFPGYVLIHMEVTDDTLHLVRNTDGIQGFIGSAANSKKPTPLSDKEVRGILEFTKVKQLPTYQSAFNVNDAVKVTDGPFKEFIGTVQEVNESKGQVTVLLSIFGRETPVQLDFLQVTKI
jgi:transcriptional antiterminator NusG